MWPIGIYSPNIYKHPRDVKRFQHTQGRPLKWHILFVLIELNFCFLRFVQSKTAARCMEHCLFGWSELCYCVQYDVVHEIRARSSCLESCFHLHRSHRPSYRYVEGAQEIRGKSSASNVDICKLTDYKYVIHFWSTDLCSHAIDSIVWGIGSSAQRERGEMER